MLNIIRSFVHFAELLKRNCDFFSSLFLCQYNKAIYDQENSKKSS